ncbi:uncharacterized protein AMSG_02272 [Thecamonas trahens ATCC 50062]|uniref:Amino acid transporter transmembrane domain-containing protein n=1 Tax=Thecamonas trahens ATCC 50062 TaxID=461836 RepID=A0A0L0DVU5_THETB|nr:hypothetical protein AMSG_02272 [Thecamonas trahens ATCC 50062]KNC56302.1 hypothetical protein AMSG_02272 [Thecamonas trahens ATCC 50062]|eukprot:XP_013760821.1 hypothetical protein AMSG_02272 [Thecamonas trahens ATCC 50062]
MGGESRSYGGLVTLSIIVNYVLGVGLLALPYVFRVAGIGLAVVAIVIGGIFTHITAMLVAEAEDLSKRALRNGSLVLPGSVFSSHVCSSSPVLTETSPMLRRTTAASAPSAIAVNSGDVEVLSATAGAAPRLDPPLEVVDMVHLYYGPRVRVAYIIGLGTYLVGGLWAYTAIFAVALGAAFPLKFAVAPEHRAGLTCDAHAGFESDCELVYLVYIAVFAAIVIPLSFVDAASQWLVQIVLTVARYVTIAMMMIIPVAALYTDSVDAAPGAPAHPPHIAPGADDLFRWTGTGLALLTGLYSLVFQHSVPGILAPHRNKASIPLVLALSIASISILYIGLGIASALYFGESTQPSINVNYSTFRYGRADGTNVPLWGKICNDIIVLFPGISSISTYPLIALTLANSALVTLPLSITGAPGSAKRARATWVTRAAVAIPPVVGAVFVRNLTTILSYAAILAIAIGLVMPAGIWLGAVRHAAAHGIDRVAPYASVFTSRITAGTSLAFGVACLAAFVVGLVAKS